MSELEFYKSFYLNFKEAVDSKNLDCYVLGTKLNFSLSEYGKWKTPPKSDTAEAVEQPPTDDKSTPSDITPECYTCRNMLCLCKEEQSGERLCNYAPA